MCTVMGDEGDVIEQAGGRDPGVRGLDGAAAPARTIFHLRPFEAQGAAAFDDDTPLEECLQFAPLLLAPLPFERPPVEFGRAS